jgi:glycosyltransferase involved in cell wall biosynthesis
MRTLFITRDGPGLTYLESLFVPIFQRLGERGFPFDVLQFRWGNPDEHKAAERACAAAGIGYRAAPVWRGLGPLGPFGSALAGRRHVRQAIRQFGTDAVMPRGSLAALSVDGELRRTRVPMLYDSDGFDIDERVDFAGMSPTGVAYRLMRDIETLAARDAAGVLVRTPAARDILSARVGVLPGESGIDVVTNGRDETRFVPGTAADRQSTRVELGIAPGAPVVAYVGTIGFRHHTERVAAFAQAIRELAPEAHLLVLTGSPGEAEAALLAEAPRLAGGLTIVTAPPDRVPALLAAADVGTSFIRAAFSTQGVAPLKTAEYLLCGVPVVGTAGVGRNAAAVEAGVFVDDAAADLGQLARWVLDRFIPQREAVRARARAVGVAEYSLARAVDDYEAALRSVARKRGLPMR